MLTVINVIPCAASPPGQVSLLRMTDAEFIRICFNMYLAMFKTTHGDGWDFQSRMAAAMDMLNKSQGQNQFAYPTMQTFVRVVAWAAQHVTGIDRPSVFVDLLDELENSGLVLQGHVHSELFLYMVRCGLIPVGYEGQSNGRLIGYYHPTSHPRSPYRLDSSPFYLVTLLVPKAAVARMSKYPAVVLIMAISNNRDSESHFASVHMSFVKHRALPTDRDWEDCKADADIIISNHFALKTGDAVDYEYVAFSCFAVKHQLVMTSPENSFVSLRANSQSFSSIEEVKDFGLQRIVFASSLSDTSLVACQNISGDEFCRPLYTTPTRVTDVGLEVVASVTAGGSISEVSCTLPFPAEMGVVKNTDMPVMCTPGHPLRLKMRLGRSFSVQQSFPSDMDLTSPTAQISRKSHYVKIIVRSGSARARPPKRMFPLFCIDTSSSSLSLTHGGVKGSKNNGGGRVLQFWGLPRVVLDSLPLFDFVASSKSLSEWLFTVAGAQLGANERGSDGGHLSNPPALTSMKSTIHAMLLNLIGFNHTNTKWPRLFCLSVERNNVIAIYVNGLRVDLTVGGIVLDLAICYLTVPKLQVVVQLIMEGGGGRQHSVTMTEEEHAWWVEAGPTLQERARDGWKHRTDCEYFKSSTNGVSVEIPRRDTRGDLAEAYVSPICTCGCGSASLVGTPFYEQYASKYPQAVAEFTRVAVSPLYPLFTAHQFHEEIRQKQPTEREKVTSPGAVAKSAVAQAAPKEPSPNRIGSGEDRKYCDNCHKQSSTLLVCARCKKVSYCGTNCQKAAWNVHKLTCKPPDEAKAGFNVDDLD